MNTEPRPDWPGTTRLQEVLGTDPATTLMNHLPPVTAADLLTKTEFANFRNDGERFDNVNRRIDRVLIAVIGGLFVVVAAFIGTAAL